jgi:hypothetical protein
LFASNGGGGGKSPSSSCAAWERASTWTTNEVPRLGSYLEAKAPPPRPPHSDDGNATNTDDSDACVEVTDEADERAPIANSRADASSAAERPSSFVSRKAGVSGVAGVLLALDFGCVSGGLVVHILQLSVLLYLRRRYSTALRSQLFAYQLMKLSIK